MARFFFVKKKTPAQSLRECSVKNLTNEKKHASPKPAAKVLKFCFITKVSRKIIYFVKSTLQNYRICI